MRRRQSAQLNGNDLSRRELCVGSGRRWSIAYGVAGRSFVVAISLLLPFVEDLPRGFCVPPPPPFAPILRRHRIDRIARVTRIAPVAGVCAERELSAGAVGRAERLR